MIREGFCSSDRSRMSERSFCAFCLGPNERCSLIVESVLTTRVYSAVDWRKLYLRILEKRHAARRASRVSFPNTDDSSNCKKIRWIAGYFSLIAAISIMCDDEFSFIEDKFACFFCSLTKHADSSMQRYARRNDAINEREQEGNNSAGTRALVRESRYNLSYVQ